MDFSSGQTPSSTSSRPTPARTLPEAGRLGKSAILEHMSQHGSQGRPLCRWCRMEILAPRRRTFCSVYCVHAWRLRSDPGYLREQVFTRDGGLCALCALDTVAAYKALRRSRGRLRGEMLTMWSLASVNARRSLWDADHILPVAEGGGQCDLDNLRTLCLLCHREVTANLRRRLSGAGSGARGRWIAQKG